MTPPSPCLYSSSKTKDRVISGFPKNGNYIVKELTSNLWKKPNFPSISL